MVEQDLITDNLTEIHIMLRTFNTRTNALKALKDFSSEAVKHAKELLTEKDGKFIFDEDAAEKYLQNQEDMTNNAANTLEITMNVKTATTRELVEFYNDHAESTISKFRDRATAERRCQEILDAIAAEEPVVEKDERTQEDRDAVFAIFAQPVPNPLQPVPALTVEVKPADRALSATQANTMKTSLKLDRTIVWLNTGEEKVYDNAHQMWKANPAIMTSSQQDTLTAKLYKAAKEGIKLIVTINGNDFQLKNV